MNAAVEPIESPLMHSALVLRAYRIQQTELDIEETRTMLEALRNLINQLRCTIRQNQAIGAVLSTELRALNRATTALIEGRSVASESNVRDLNSTVTDYGLTRRESQVLQLVASGLTNKEIALGLKCSVYTVYKHVGQILDKLAVQSRTEASVKALVEGLLQKEPPVRMSA